MEINEDILWRMVNALELIASRLWWIALWVFLNSGGTTVKNYINRDTIEWSEKDE